MLDQRGEGEAVKMLKTNYYKSLLASIFVQTRSVISINNGMYIACSYDTYQWTGHTYWTKCRIGIILPIYQKQWHIVDPFSMHKEHWRLKFYAAHIIFPCI